MHPEYSVIIVTHNGLNDLRKCIDSLYLQRRPGWEIVVVDNASSDGTRPFLESLSSDFIRCLFLDSNTGFAVANNVGTAQARGNWLFLLNNDTTCRDGTLQALEDGVHAFPKFHIFSSHMIRSSDGNVDNLGIRFSRYLGGIQIESGTAAGWSDSREVFGASGGAMLVHRSVIEDIGLFDTEFFAYQEDVDFAVRARLAGYRCLYLPEALVYHKGGGTSSSNPSLFRYYNQRNMELVLRNIPSDLLWKYGWGHFVYTAYQVAKWSFKGEGWNVLKAKFDAFKILWKSGTRQLPIRVKSTEFGKYLASDFSAYAPSTLRSYQGVSQD